MPAAPYASRASPSLTHDERPPPVPGTTDAARPGTVAIWAATRLVLATAVLWHYSTTHALTGDVVLYARWSRTLVGGHLPTGDPSWQYPPLAGTLFAAVRLLADVTGAAYLPAFVVSMLGVDALVAWLLARRSDAGLRVWALGGLLLGPLLLHRFDLAPTACAVAGLVLLAEGRPRLGGALLGAGALLKVWPAAGAVAAGGPRRLLRLLVGMVATGLAVVVVLGGSGRLGEAMDFAHQQRSRGLEVEAVAALPWLVLRALHLGGATVAHTYGSYQVAGPGTAAATALCTVASALVVLLAAVATWRGWTTGDPVGAVLAVVTALMLLSRVLSPQYLVWPLGLVALAVAQRPRDPVVRRTAALLMAACLLTQVEYPFLFSPLVHGGGVTLPLLLARDGLLAAVCLRSARGAWQRRAAARPGPAG